MSDILTRVISENGKTFGIACDTTALVNEACRKHDVGPLAAVALGRALTGSILMGALLKGDQYLQLKFEGNGPLGKIITEASPDGWCRGYIANPHAELPLLNGRLDVAGGVGHAGLLSVTKDIGMKQKYQGTSHLVSSEIGEDIAYYLTTSEQVPSAVGLGIQLNPNGTIDAAGGFLIQSLPPADEELIASMEEVIANLPSISSMILDGQSPRQMLDKLFGAIPHKETGNSKLKYQCSCSREKMENALISLGAADLASLLTERGEAEVLCEFCRQNYHFAGKDLQEIIDRLKNIQ
ncbi:Hsp33 family molecular chaperone HslO [Desulfotalea psychrophila]|uniref:33 kDa chaperonin n=1 Tax=Desulfotalea psychrophila (strain LSv54 / DSM 12343) TaxID=177439 RepID=HSLO_DESPS|nr:Hsp33 family molecular chaperone HslO [Desulfotalea psychrophila]Q6AQT4.1 RecName: Full=33 kDa chaperonin; AltName: Full=Heat shock protein 33 homolog; Short=HSP33 [Desulfotalea psychrophila LSv54]CAG35289.1 related to 33 kDa chaperonin (Hsp33) [Desulfotalea psychrophila LSv54]